MKKINVVLFMLLMFSGSLAAGLHFGMTGAIKEEVKNLDNKVREKHETDAIQLNHAPVFSWTGETNYISDGLDPEIGTSTTTFTYRIKYTDADGDAPAIGYPQVNIRKKSTENTWSVFSMTKITGDYVTGAIYSYSTKLSTGTDYLYYFWAKDSKGAAVSNVTVEPINAPDVSGPNNALSGPWFVQTVDSSVQTNYLSLALGTDGYPHISYYDFVNKVLKYANWNGSSWNFQTVDSISDPGYRNRISVDSNNYPCISYSTNAGVLKYTKWTGASWNIQTVDTSGWDSSMKLDSNGYPYIAYYANWSVLKLANWIGSSWNIQTVDPSSVVGGSSFISIDSSGKPCISYYDLTNKALKYANWNGSSWNLQTVDSTGEAGKYGTALALDSNGCPQIMYCDYVNKVLKYAKWDGSSWVKQTITSNINTNTSIGSLVINQTGKACISYVDNNSQLQYAEWDGSSWNAQTIDNGYYPSLLIGASGSASIAYMDSQSHLKYASQLP
jgi:hypothetical protein